MHDPRVPETLEGWSVLHQMFRIKWESWKGLPPARRREIAESAASLLGSLEGRPEGPSALVSLLGHKADLMLIHFRKSFEELSGVELRMTQTDLHDYLVPATSYVSLVELGLYDMTGKIHEDLAGRGLKVGASDFESAFDAELSRQRDRMMSRLFTDIPRRRHVCFYPMNKRRGETRNWYMLPFEKRAAMMREHGLIGRAYSGQVTQIISGSIGLDDWEWGVDLFVDDPVVLKKLIYDMRFDEASAVYAEFGPFYVGLQFAARDLPSLLEGQPPAL
jgi:hydrogen peroxide-dependent heme synthase